MESFCGRTDYLLAALTVGLNVRACDHEEELSIASFSLSVFGVMNVIDLLIWLPHQLFLSKNPTDLISFVFALLCQ